MLALVGLIDLVVLVNFTIQIVLVRDGLIPILLYVEGSLLVVMPGLLAVFLCHRVVELIQARELLKRLRLLVRGLE